MFNNNRTRFDHSNTFHRKLSSPFKAITLWCNQWPVYHSEFEFRMHSVLNEWKRNPWLRSCLFGWSVVWLAAYLWQLVISLLNLPNSHSILRFFVNGSWPTGRDWLWLCYLSIFRMRFSIKKEIILCVCLDEQPKKDIFFESCSALCTRPPNKTMSNYCILNWIIYFSFFSELYSSLHNEK